MATANDYWGYFPDPFQYEEHASDLNYERMLCLFGPNIGQLVQQAALFSVQERTRARWCGHTPGVAQ